MKFSASTVATRWPGPLGPMLLAASARGLAGVWFTDQKHLPNSAPWPQAQGHAVLQRACTQLAEYFAGQRRHFDLPLDLSGGTDFQQAVWQGLVAIPCGQTTSYGELARSIARPTAVRALGAAVGHNPISIVVPCHRVLGTDGSLTGYAGGLQRKAALLALEGIAVPGGASGARP